jgi:hypothetical protein
LQHDLTSVLDFENGGKNSATVKAAFRNYTEVHCLPCEKTELDVGCEMPLN